MANSAQHSSVSTVQSKTIDETDIHNFYNFLSQLEL